MRGASDIHADDLAIVCTGRDQIQTRSVPVQLDPKFGGFCSSRKGSRGDLADEDEESEEHHHCFLDSGWVNG